MLSMTPLKLGMQAVKSDMFNEIWSHIVGVTAFHARSVWSCKKPSAVVREGNTRKGTLRNVCVVRIDFPSDRHLNSHISLQLQKMRANLQYPTSEEGCDTQFYPMTCLDTP